MRDDQVYFWVGMGAALAGSLALLMDHFVFHADLLEPSATPHTLFFPAGVFAVLAGGAALIAAYARD